MPSKIEGLIAATYTPLTNEGELNLSQVGPLVEHLLSSGVDGLFVGGSTGEGMSLTTAERKDLTAEFVQTTSGRVPVMVHVGHNSLADAADLAAHAASVGAAAVSATCPSYYPINALDTLISSMAQVATAAKETPFYYYHIPVLTGVDLSMPAFLREAQARIPNLVGLKYTKPTIHEYQQCLELNDGQFDVLWGLDEMLLSALVVGARGAVGSTYNIAAPLYRRLMDHFAAGEMEQARELQAKSVEIIDLIAQHPFHPAMKHILRWQGVDCGPARLPMPSLGPDAWDSLRSQLEGAGLKELAAESSPQRATA